MHRTILIAIVCAVALCGCAVVKTTDVTDASFKRHQSVSLLGWPVYSRVTDKEPGTTSQVATRIEAVEDPNFRHAEMLGRSIDVELSIPEAQEP